MILWLCRSTQRHTKIFIIVNISSAGSWTSLISWFQICPYFPPWQGERGSFWVTEMHLCPGWGRDSCLICSTCCWEKRQSRVPLPLKAAQGSSTSRMQWPELEFCQDSGINFPSAGQKGPRDFYFYSFSITTAQQRKQAPQQCEPPRVIFLCWVPCQYHTSCWPHFTEVLRCGAWLLTSLLTIMGERHYDCPIKAVCFKGKIKQHMHTEFTVPRDNNLMGRSGNPSKCRSSSPSPLRSGAQRHGDWRKSDYRQLNVNLKGSPVGRERKGLSALEPGSRLIRPLREGFALVRQGVCFNLWFALFFQSHDSILSQSSKHHLLENMERQIQRIEGTR